MSEAATPPLAETPPLADAPPQEQEGKEEAKVRRLRKYVLKEILSTEQIYQMNLEIL